MSERFADPIDEAAALSAALTDAAIKSARQSFAPEAHPSFDGVHCVDCEGDIHPSRIQLRKVRCVDCQTDLEARQKRGLQ